MKRYCVVERFGLLVLVTVGCSACGTPRQLTLVDAPVAATRPRDSSWTEWHSCTNELGQLVAKYLPGYSLGAVLKSEIGGSVESASLEGKPLPIIELMGAGGERIPDGTGWRGSDAPAGRELTFRNSRLNALLRDQHVTVRDLKTARELTRLIVGLGRGEFSLGKDWAYAVERRRDGWIITPQWVGRPCMVPGFNQCRLVVDAHDRFVEFWEEGRSMTVSIQNRRPR